MGLLGSTPGLCPSNQMPRRPIRGKDRLPSPQGRPGEANELWIAARNSELVVPMSRPWRGSGKGLRACIAQERDQAG
jgi:hypothetical protein